MPGTQKISSLPVVRHDSVTPRPAPQGSPPPELVQGKARQAPPETVVDSVPQSSQAPVLRGRHGLNAGLLNLESLLASLPLKLDRE
jgi:hypothetical protein